MGYRVGEDEDFGGGGVPKVEEFVENMPFSAEFGVHVVFERGPGKKVFVSVWETYFESLELLKLLLHRFFVSWRGLDSDKEKGYINSLGIQLAIWLLRYLIECMQGKTRSLHCTPFSSL